MTAKVEDDKKEVEGDHADDAVCLRQPSLLFEVLEGRVLGELWWQQLATALVGNASAGCAMCPRDYVPPGRAAPDSAGPYLEEKTSCR